MYRKSQTGGKRAQTKKYTNKITVQSNFMLIPQDQNTEKKSATLEMITQTFGRHIQFEVR